MAKYPRKGSQFLGLNRRNVIWIAIGALILLIGSFVAGSYYGYSQGYRDGFSQAQSEKSENETTGEAPPEQAKRSPNESEEGDGEDFENVITGEDMDRSRDSRSDETQEEDNTSETSMNRDSPSPRAPDTSSRDRNRGEDDETSSLAVEGGGLTEGPPEDSTDSGEETTSDESSTDDPNGATSSEETSGTSTEIMESDGPVFSIQVLSVSDQEKARGRVEELTNTGHEAVLTTATIDGQEWYRVRVGKFSSREEAQSRADTLQDDGVIDDYWISRLTN